MPLTCVKVCSICLLFGLVVIGLASAKALTFNITYDPSIGGLSAAEQSSVRSAVNYITTEYAGDFTNDVTLNITIKYDPKEELASSVSNYEDNAYSYSQIRSALVAVAPGDATDLPAGNPTSYPAVTTTSAEAKGLGLPLLGTPDESDGTITFGPGPWTFYPTEPRAATGRYDFTSGIEHEISEVMGRQTLLDPASNHEIGPLDFFRYSAAGVRSLSTRTNASGTAVYAYFSLDNGQTNLRTFNDVSDGDISDWAGDNHDSYDAFGPDNEAEPVTTIDLQAMNAIGWAEAPVAKLLNISTRMEVLAGDNVLIGGFIVTGSSTKKVLVRALGPSLPVNGALTDPLLELHSAKGVIAINDNWKVNAANGQSQQTTIEATGAPPNDDRESALIADLPANNSSYTAVVRGQSGTIGIGQVEVYDLDASAASQLANISTRGYVDTGDNVVIGGVIVGPGNTRTPNILVRAIGPSLGINGELADPILELHNANGALIDTNDNWKIIESSGDSQQAAIEATGIPPSNDFEAALLEVVSPGNYTAIVRGKNSSTGIALLEAYNLQ